MKRRVLSILTALALCLSLCPTWAFAAPAAEDPAVTVLTVEDNQDIYIQTDENGQVKYNIWSYTTTKPVKNGTFTGLVLTGSAQNTTITFNGAALPENTSVTLRDLQITANSFYNALTAYFDCEIRIEGDVSLSAGDTTISVDEGASVCLTGPGNLTVTQTQGGEDALIQNLGSLTIGVEGDVRMEAPNGFLFDNKSGTHPISISGKNITLSDSTDDTSFEGVTLALGGMSSINGHFPVAKTGDTFYIDLQAAFDAAAKIADGGTVTLLKDVTVDKAVTLSAGTVTLTSPVGEKHTLTGSGLETISINQNGAALKVENVTVENTYDETDTGFGFKLQGVAIMVVYLDTSLTIADPAEVRATGLGGLAISSSGTLTILGGTVSATGSGGTGISFNSGTAEVKGGTISGTAKGLNIASEVDLTSATTVRLTGGTFTGTTGDAIFIKEARPNTLEDLVGEDLVLLKDGKPVDMTKKETGAGTVSVGRCNHAGGLAPSENGYQHGGPCKWCGAELNAANHTLGADGNCTDCSAALAAQVDNVYYETVQAAFNAAAQISGGGTVTLMKDVTVTKAIKMSSGTVALNGQGHTLTGTDIPTIFVAGGALTLEDVTVRNENPSGYGISMSDGSKPTITINATAAVLSSGLVGINQDSGSLTVSGRVEGTNVNGTGISAKHTTLTVEEGAVISGGSDSGTGIEQAGGTLTVNGGTISGYSGLSVTASGDGTNATVHLNGGTFTGTGGSAITAAGPSSADRALSTLMGDGYTIYKEDGTVLTAEELDGNKTDSGTFIVGCAHPSLGTVTATEPENGVVTVAATCSECGKTVTLGTLTMVGSGQKIDFGDVAPTFEVQTEGLMGVSYSWNSGGSTESRYQPSVTATGDLEYPCAVTFDVPGGESMTVNLTFTLKVSQLDIKNAEITVELVPETSFIVPYNGQKQGPDITKVLIGGNQFHPSLFDITLVDAFGNPVEGKNAGTYNIKLTVKEDGPITGTKTLDDPVFVIEKAEPAIEWATPTAELTYGYAQHTFPKPTVKVTGMTSYDGAFTYSYATAEAGPYKQGLPTDAGTYYIKAAVPEQDNYTAAETAGPPLKLTIQKAQTEITTAPTAVANLTYNGTAQALVTAAEASVGEVQYSLTGEDGSWSKEIPTGKNAGEYTVYYKVPETDNYTGVAAASVKAEIGKATWTKPIERELLVKNKQAKDYTLDLSTLLPTPPGGQEYGTVEYGKPNLLGTVEVYGDYFNSGSVTIKDQVLTVSVNAVENDEQKELAEIQVPVTSGNFAGVELTIKVSSTNKTPVNITGVEAAGWTYDGTVHNGYTGTPSAGEYTGDLDVTYFKLPSGEQLTGKPKDAGSYRVVFSVPEEGTSFTGSAEVSFTVEQAQVTVKADDKTAYVGEEKPALTYQASGLAEGEDLKAAPTLACTPDMTKAGTYDITVSGAVLPDGGNYKADIVYQSGTLTVSEKPAPPVDPPKPPVDPTVSVTGVTLDKTGLTLTVGGSERLTATVAPGNATNKSVTWASSDTAVATVDGSGNVTAAGAGTAIVTVTTADGGKTAACTVTVKTSGGSSGGGSSSGGSGSSGGGSGSGSTPSTPPVTTDKTTEGSVSTTETTAKPSATTKGDTATTNVSTSVGNEIVKQAEKNKSDNVVIAPEIKGDVTKTEVSIPAKTVEQISSKTEASLTVSTPVADVTIPNEALGGLSESGGSVKVTAERTGNTVELSVTVGGKAVDSIPVTVTVPVEEPKPSTVAVLVREDGTRQVIRKSTADENGVTVPLDGSAKIEIVDNGKTFDDVPAESWKAEAAAFVSARELFHGTAPGQFSPDVPMSRGMLAVVLHNLENNPDAALMGAFTDVDSGKWYAEGVAWAAANGIVSGYGNGQYGPGNDLTREQMAVMLWRYAGSPAATEQELRFNDADKASSWALEALRWALENGVMGGRGDGVLDPAGKTTRAEAAQMLKNFLEGKR